MNTVELKVGQIWAVSFPSDGGKKKTGYRINSICIAPNIVENKQGSYFSVSEVKGTHHSVFWTGRTVVDGKVYLPDNWTLIEDTP